ncbi:hypothetical protein PSQ20_17630 [Curvibacter sp. RS43]|uniref:Uncharacterized protein n=1 Tax=Curvibacter microcysteis TaxID=3026419 RepID=A0ABT5M974_9BURK|nr:MULTISPECIES: hypothetical protein [unclassified Curvibacter]MDD0812176.1 hypothetical protein [Curvibacter sp. RS43]MDD0813140.1 hypothetical protein [Curvibacter sp. HBC28]
MRLLLAYLLSVLLLTAALFQGEATAVVWSDEPDTPLMGDVLAEASPCEVLTAEPDVLEEALRVSIQLYQPPVTNDDRTELFWSPVADPEPPRASVPVAETHPLQSRPVWPQPLLRPPRQA